jgi:hypothetical protein
VQRKISLPTSGVHEQDAGDFGSSAGHCLLVALVLLHLSSCFVVAPLLTRPWGPPVPLVELVPPLRKSSHQPPAAIAARPRHHADDDVVGHISSPLSLSNSGQPAPRTTSAVPLSWKKMRRSKRLGTCSPV